MENKSLVMESKELLRKMPKALMVGFERMTASEGKKLLRNMIEDLEIRRERDGLTAAECKAYGTLTDFEKWIER